MREDRASGLETLHYKTRDSPAYVDDTTVFIGNLQFDRFVIRNNLPLSKDQQVAVPNMNCPVLKGTCFYRKVSSHAVEYL